MKTMLLLSLVATSMFATGCATAPPTRAELDGLYVCNAARMAQVDRQARLDGREIHWIHCPLAKLRVAG